MALRDDVHDKKDLFVGATGAVVLTVLVVALFWVRGVAPGPGMGGGPGDGLGLYDVNFDEEAHDVDLGGDASGTVAAGESVTVEVVVDAANVTAFSATLEWMQDPVPLFQDELGIAVDGPSGSVDCQSKKTGPSGSLPISCQGVTAPEPIESLAASSPADARARAALQEPAQFGATGTYTITITLEDAGADDQVDSDQDYTLSVDYTDYHVHAERTGGGPSE